MDQTLSALSNILLQALPTFFLVVFLIFYLGRVFFRPLGQVLEKRREATEGARRRAEEMFQKAEQKAAEYEAALQAARGELYREQEAERQKSAEAHSARLREARAQAQSQLDQAKVEIARDTAAARQSLGAQAEAMAEQIVHRVLGKGAAA
jgi:F-type H+-transporting ATPase subunit b